MRRISFFLRSLLFSYTALLLIIVGIEFLFVEGVPGISSTGARSLINSFIYWNQVRTLHIADYFLNQSPDVFFIQTHNHAQKEFLDRKGILLGIIKKHDNKKFEILIPKQQYVNVNSWVYDEENNEGRSEIVIDEEEYLIVFQKSDIKSEYLFTGIEHKTLFNMMKPWVVSFVIINSIFIILLFIVTYYLLKTMLRPIRELAVKIQAEMQIGYSDYNKRDEIEVLQKLINRISTIELEKRRAYESKLRKNTKELIQTNSELKAEITKRQQEEQFYLKTMELYRLLAVSTASSYFSQFLKYLREMFHSEVAILAFLGDGDIKNIYFNSSENQKIMIPLGGRSLPINHDKRIVLIELAKTKILYLDKPKMSIFGKCRLNRAVVFAVTLDNEVVAVLQLGESYEEYSFLDRTHIEHILYSIEPTLIAVIQEENLLRQRRDAIKDKQETEEQFRKIFDASQDMLIDIDRDGKITQINNSGMKLLGFENVEEIIGKALKGFFLQEDAFRYLFDHIRKQGYIKDHEIVLQIGEDHLICLVSATAEYSGNGEFGGFSGSVKDITRRVELDSQLWKTNIELSDANEQLKQTQMQVIQNEKLASIGQLSAGIAHEINNPLGFIKSNFNSMDQYTANLLKCIDDLSQHIDSRVKTDTLAIYEYDYIKNDIQDLLSETSDGIERILKIVENLKNFSRVDVLSNDWDLLNIPDAIVNTLMIARNEYKYHVTVENLVQDIPQIECRSGEIKQVLLNMIINSSQAIKEKMNDGGRIRISGIRQRDSVRIIIEDNGPGIPEDCRLRIFDPFYTTKEVGKGTGLGLSISYDIIVNKHKGSVHVEESELGGAKFVITLPVFQDKEINFGELQETE